MCITHSEYSFPQPSVFPFSSFFNWKRKNQKNHSQIPDRHLSVSSLCPHGYCLFLWRKLQIQMFPSSSLTLTSVSSLYVLAEFHSTGRHHSEIIYGLQTSPKVIYTLQPPNSPAKPENPKLAETVVNWCDFSLYLHLSQQTRCFCWISHCSNLLLIIGYYPMILDNGILISAGSSYRGKYIVHCLSQRAGILGPMEIPDKGNKMATYSTHQPTKIIRP